MATDSTPSPKAKHNTSPTPDSNRLTPSEIELLRADLRSKLAEMDEILAREEAAGAAGRQD